MRAARPRELPGAPDLDVEPERPEGTGPALPEGGGDAAPIVPDRSADDVRPESVGTFGLPFTTSRVFPDAAVLAYPYRTVGRLFFFDQFVGGDFVCSASVIGRRIVLTAGHCLFDPVRDAFFRDFAFVPAFNGTLARQPFGTWTTSFRVVTAAWANGNNTFPNRADFGILVARDRTVGGRPRRLAEIVGALGTTTFALLGNHVSALGYPVNLDRGLRMQVTAAEVVPFRPLAGVIGSAMRGGSSGGPWVQDFGVPADGQAVTSSGPNRVVGVTSFGAINPRPQVIGSSVLNAEFARIRARACGQAPGNC